MIVVVKGAGLQKADETLRGFLDGFWPALNRLDPTATLTQRHDLLPADYAPPYDAKPLNIVTEIRCGERRIWIKEPNWDARRSVPDGPLGTLNKEWRMATYASPVGYISYWQTLTPTDASYPRASSGAGRVTCSPWPGQIELSFCAGLALSWSFGQHGHLPQLAIWAAALAVPALVLAINPTRQTIQRKSKPTDPNDVRAISALPGSPNWILLVLLVTFAISPWGYLPWVCVWPPCSGNSAGAGHRLALSRDRE